MTHTEPLSAYADGGSIFSAPVCACFSSTYPNNFLKEF